MLADDVAECVRYVAGNIIIKHFLKRNQALIIASAIALHSGVLLSVLLVPLGDLAGDYFRLLMCE